MEHLGRSEAKAFQFFNFQNLTTLRSGAAQILQFFVTIHTAEFTK